MDSPSASAAPGLAPASVSWLRRLWRWSFRLLLVLLVMLAALAVFHRPIVLWLLNHYGPEGARSAGYAMQWQVDGSVTSSLSLANLQLTPLAEAKEPSPLQSLRAAKVELGYDVQPAWHGDYLRVPQSIMLHDVEAALDLRQPKPQPTKPAKPTDWDAIAKLLKSLVLPVIDIRHLNVAVQLPADAAQPGQPAPELRVQDFNLSLPRGQDGELRIGSIEHPALAAYPLKNVRARLRLDGQRVSLHSLELLPGVGIDEVIADVTDIAQQLVKVQAQLHSGSAKLSARATASLAPSQPGKGQPVDVELDLSQVDAAELRRWLPSLPAAFAARLKTLKLTAKGDATAPQSLSAKVQMEVEGIGFQAWQDAALSLNATLQNGRLEVTSLRPSLAGNALDLSASIAMPATWQAMAAAPIDCRWQLTAPALDKLPGLPVKLAGSVISEGSASLSNQHLDRLKTQLTGQALSVDGQTLRTLELSAEGNLDRIAFTASAEAAAGDGKLKASGEVGLKPGSQSDITWSLLVPKPQALVSALKLTWPADIAVGEVASEGRLSLDLAAVKAHRYDSAKGSGKLSVKALSWREAPCEISAQWALEQQRAQLSELVIDLPGSNQAKLSASLALDEAMPFEATLALGLQRLDELGAWFKAANVQGLKSGAVDLAWSGKGSLRGGLGAAEALPSPRPSPGGRGRSSEDTARLGAAAVADDKPKPGADANKPRSSLADGTQQQSQLSPSPSGRGRGEGSNSTASLFTLTGNAKLHLTALQHTALPAPAALDAELSHTLDSANIKSLTASLGPWSLALAGSGSRRLVDVTAFKLAHQTQALLEGHARVPLDLQAKPLPLSASEPMDVLVQLPQPLCLQSLNDLRPGTLPQDVTGNVMTRIEARGTLATLDAKVEVQATDLEAKALAKTLPGQEPGKASLLITLKDQAFAANLSAQVKPLEPLALEVKTKADVPALLADASKAMELPITGSARFKQASLAFLQPLLPMLSAFEGAVDVDLQASGTAKSPQLAGQVIIELPRVVPRDPDLPLVKDFKLKLTGEGTRLKLEQLHASAAGGSVDVTGSCDLKDLTQPAFDVSLKAADLLAVRNDFMTLRSHADLHCIGTPKAAKLSGSIGLTRGRVLQEIDFLPLNKMMNDLPPLPDEKANKPAADDASAASPASPLPAALKDWSFDLAVKTADPIRLLGNVMSGDAVLDMKLSGTGAAPVATGQASIERGMLTLPFSTLHIRTGKVTLLPDKLLAPSLELHAESQVDRYEIALRGYGNVLAPKLRFSSTPPLPEGEIATLLATGATTSGLAKAGDDTASRAVWLLLRQAYQKVFVSKKSRRGADRDKKPSESRFLVQEQSEDGAVGGVTGIYEFSRKMKIVSSTSNDGSFRAMFHYLFRF